VRARLFARTGDLAGTSFEIGESAAIGRLPDNQVVLPGGLVSGHHCKITFDPRAGCYVLEDLGSRNGTFVAGTRVREPEKLGRLDVINFAGAFDFIFQVPAEGAAAASPEPPPPAPAAAPPAPPAGGGTMIDREIAVLPAGLAAAAEEAGAPASGGTMIDREIADLPAVLSAAAAAAEAPAPGGTKIDRYIPELPAVLSAAAQAVAAPAPGGTLIDREVAELPAALSAAAAEAAPVPVPEAAPAPPAAPAAPAVMWALRVERAAGWETFDLPTGEHVLGRGTDCDLAIDDRGLSRRHARLVVSADRVAVVDLGSTNRTTVAGQRALPDEVTAVEPGAELVFGALKAELIRKGAGS